MSKVLLLVIPMQSAEFSGEDSTIFIEKTKNLVVKTEDLASLCLLCARAQFFKFVINIFGFVLLLGKPNYIGKLLYNCYSIIKNFEIVSHMYKFVRLIGFYFNFFDKI